MSPCSDCGYNHSTAADRIACAAIQGRIRGFPEVPEDGVEWACTLCGYLASFSDLVEHFYRGHSGDLPPSGHLVRAVMTYPKGDVL